MCAYGPAAGREARSYEEVIDAKLAGFDTTRRETVSKTWAVGPSQFEVQDASNACTAISLALVVHLIMHVSPRGNYDSLCEDVSWRTIMLTGAALYKRYCKANPGFYGNVEARSLFECGHSSFDIIRQNTHITREFHGHVDEQQVGALDPGAHPQTLLEVLSSIPEKSGLILTSSDNDISATVSITRIGTSSTLWIFDSHGSMDTATPSSILIRCADAGVAADALVPLVPNGIFSAVLIERSMSSE